MAAVKLLGITCLLALPSLLLALLTGSLWLPHPLAAAWSALATDLCALASCLAYVEVRHRLG